MLDESGTKLCNFVPHVDGIVEKEAVCEGKSEVYVNVRLEFYDGYSRIITIPVEKINQTQWWKEETHCCLNPEISESKVRRYLTNAVRSDLNNAPKKRLYQLNRTGMFMINGEAIFCTGKETIRSPASKLSEPEIELLKMKQHLEIDPKLSEAEAVAEMFGFISLSPNAGRVILMHKLIYLMRQAYVDAGAIPQICVYLYGKTGTNKTTFSSFLLQMYDRSKGIISPLRLNASRPAVVEMLTETYDDTIVLDDLFPAESASMRRQQEETLIEITRCIADGIIPAKMRGGKILKDTLKCGVVFTGEYLIGGGSDAARLLSVEMEKPDSQKLKYFQDRPLMISTFYYFLLVCLFVIMTRLYLC